MDLHPQFLQDHPGHQAPLGCTCEEADLPILESPMGSPSPIRELPLTFPGREATLLTPEMTTTIPPPQLSTESYDLTAVAAGAANAALFQAVALSHSRDYRDHIRKLLLIGLEELSRSDPASPRKP